LVCLLHFRTVQHCTRSACMAPANIMKRGSKRELEGDPDDADDLTEDLQINLDTLEKLWATPCIV